MRQLDAQQFGHALSMGQAIDALHEAFASGPPATPERLFVNCGKGQLIVMPAAGDGCAGAKLLTLNPPNADLGAPLIQGAFVLFDGPTLEPRAVVDGAALTRLRTAAVSGLATRLMARPDAERLVIFGAGVQAHAHLDAMCAVRPVGSLVVVDPDSSRADALVHAARSAGLTAERGEPDAVAQADLVCCCTTSSSPLFDGERVARGAHVNAMGSYQPHTREVDDELVRRAWIAVETRAAALAEAGDLLLPIATGVIDAGAITAELVDLASARVSPPADADVTLFKSVGVAFEDLVIARAAVAAVEAQ